MEILAKPPTVKARADRYTGDVWLDPIAMVEAPAKGPETDWGDQVSDAEYVHGRGASE